MALSIGVQGIDVNASSRSIEPEMEHVLPERPEQNVGNTEEPF